MRWRFFSKNTLKDIEPYLGRVEIFSRHCFFSDISQHKKRLDGFSREACYRNLLGTVDLTKVNLTFLLDIAKGTDHFLNREHNHPVIEIREGTEAGAFLQLLAFVEQLHLHPQTILYLVEDDYLHRLGWLDVLQEGMQIPGVDYVTLFDHQDKYLPLYHNLRSTIYISPTCHWRTTPSTTQTFAVRWKTLQEDLAIHRRYSKGKKITEDHQKFVHLSKRGRTLISPMPGWSTHVELGFTSPCIDWNQLQKL